MVREIDPKRKKKKGKGTRITLRGRNKAEKSTSRNKNLPNSRKRGRISRINEKRSEKAIKNKNFKEVSSTKVISPARKEVVKPASTKIVKSSDYQIVEVRAGDSEKFGKERNLGDTPSTKGSARKNRLQAALMQARKDKKEFIIFEGKKYAAGKNIITEKSITTPAITKDIPAVTKTTVNRFPQFDKKIAKPKKRKRTSKLKSTNSIVQRVSVTQGKKK